MARLDLAKIAPKQILTKSGNKSYPLKVSYQGEKVLIANTKDRHNGTYTKSYLRVPKNKVCLWYKWPAGRNQYQRKNTGYRFKYLLIPKQILLDKLTLNALGLLQAEMTKYTRRASNIIFTNSEPNLINVVVAFFKRFDVNENNWSWTIVFNYKLKNQENLRETKHREKQAREFWLKNTKIDLKKKRKKIFQYTGNKKYRNMRKDTNIYGNLTISYSNIILYQLILEILSKIKLNLARKETKYYLQGIFAGEGSIKLTKFKSIDNVNVGAGERVEQDFYANCLKTLNIISSLEKNCVKIHNLKHFLKIYKYRLFELHPKRNRKFLNGLKKFKQIPDNLKGEYLNVKNEL